MTTKESKRLLDLVSDMHDTPEADPIPAPVAHEDAGNLQDPLRRRGRVRSKTPIPDTPHGERADFLKMTITLSPEVYGLFMDEIARRKKVRQKGATVSAIIREMAGKYLIPLHKDASGDA